MTDQPEKLFRYHGLSMWPCFQERDLLEIEPVEMAMIRVGDCLVFRGEEDQQVVHRVLGKGIVLTTRGDAFKQADEHTVSEHSVIGRVVYRHRMGRRTSVANGLIGHAAGRIFHFAGRIDPQRCTRGGHIGISICRLSLTGLRPLWQRGKVHSLQRIGEVPVTVWKLGSLTVGSQAHSSKEWTVLWPWRIVVRLPLGDEGEK